MLIAIYWIMWFIVWCIVGWYVDQEGYSYVEAFCAALVAAFVWPLTIVVTGLLTLFHFVKDTW